MGLSRSNTTALKAGSATKCTSNHDCPSSYCMNDPSKKAPYQCHDCGPNCCNSDADCAKSYCMMDATKKPPYLCHGTAGNATFGSPLITNKYCTKDSDCASGGYCETYKQSVDVYLCHAATSDNDYCTGDADCPGRYCQNGASKTPI